MLRFLPIDYAASKVLPDVLLVLVALLLPELGDFVLQLDNGALDFVVLTDQGHPAVEGDVKVTASEKRMHLP